MAGHPPRGRPPTTPAACSPRRACRPRGRCWAPTPTPPRPQHVGGGPQQPAQCAGSWGRDGAWPQAPPTTVEGTPPGDALPPPPQRATPARKGARCGAGAGSPRPHRPHPGHTGRGTMAARSRGPAAGGGTAPDTRRPSQRWQATPPGDGPPPPPRQAAPTRHPPQGRPTATPTTPSQVGGNRDRTAPPQSTPDGARDRGRTRGGARTTWKGTTSAQCRDHARCAPHTTQGGGERTPRERERTHTKGTRRDYHKGNQTERAERTDCVEWRTSERG